MSSSTKTHYATLGIERDASAEQVRCAWKKLVQEWHPDRFPEDERDGAESRASEINAAYHVLRDCARRAAYDCRLAADEAAAVAAVKTRRANRVGGPRVPNPADRVGAPHVHAVSMADEPWNAERVARELGHAVSRHPRIIAATTGVWVLIVGATVAYSAVTGPALPAGGSSDRALMSVSASHESDLAAMREITEQTERDAEQAAQAMREQLAAEAATQAQLDAEAEAQARADLIAEQRAAKARAAAAKQQGAKGAAKPASVVPARRVVRVLPQP